MKIDFGGFDYNIYESGVHDNGNFTGTHITETLYEGNRRKSVTDASGNTTSFDYDALGRIVKITYPETTQNSETYVYVEYDGLGRKAWESKQTTKTYAQLTAEDLKEYEYDASGRLTAVILPQTAAMESPVHDDTTLTNASPIYEYVYDNFGNLTESRDNIYELGGNIIDTYARTTAFTYNELHQQTSRELPDTKTEHKEYDNFGRIVRATDFEKQDTKFEYNAKGQLHYKKLYAFVDVSPQDGQNDIYPGSPTETIEYTYDDLGRRKEIIETRGTTTFEYDSEGRTIVVSSPEGFARYIFDEITGRKAETRSYATTANLQTDVLALSNNDITRVQYTYDEMGRLYETKTIKRDGSTLTMPEVTTNAYDAVGNRDNTVLANSVTADYTYDNCNRLTNIVHSGSLSSFGYTLYDNGMRHTVSETLKTSSSTSETHSITYTYDNLNRLTHESATCSSPSGSYSEEYTYDVVGNRTYREVIANGQTLTTDYQYYTDGRDKLEKEIHTEPSAMLPYNNKPVYAYASNGQITHYQMLGQSADIGSFKAFLMGLPSIWSQYLFRAMMLLLPIAFFLPSLLSLRGKRPKQSRRSILWRQCVCVLLAYMMLICPCFENIAEASSQYSQIARGNWGTGNRTIEYTYDDNGSCVRKLTKQTTSPYTIYEDVVYEYNLQNKLYKVTTDNQQGTTVAVVEYTYNDEGIRVKAISYDMPRGGGTHTNEKTTTFLIDAYNHTGYAQALEESDGTNRTTYTIGDDVISQYNGTSVGHFLCDGLGSVRQLTNSNGNLITDQTFNYDSYGVLVGYNGTPQSNLRYTGEYYDTSLKQYNLRTRYYDPLNGRFNQMDSYAGNNEDPQSLHKYLYCHANPVNVIDPSGKDGELVGTLTVTDVICEMIAHAMPYIVTTLVVATVATILYMVYDMSRDYLAAGYASVATLLTSNAQAVAKAIKDVAEKIGKKVKDLSKMKLFPIIKRFTPDIFKFDVWALSSHPQWFMLTYNGAGDPQTGLNRAYITGTYGWMMAAAPPGYQLDEFPYACTRQGGPGAWARPVPAWENALQGGLLGAFTRWTLKGTPQPFIVVPIPL